MAFSSDYWLSKLHKHMPLLQGFMSQFSSKQNSKEVAKPLNSLWQNELKEPENNDSQKVLHGVHEFGG